MKSIDVELGKSNMLPLIASQQFYASWKVFIRELLLNAMDACNVRQALEWSWGTEFLEMEQASQMRDVRAIYEPRIDITYSSCLLYTSPSPRDMRRSRMPSSA